jgi:hypothetical protein
MEFGEWIKEKRGDEWFQKLREKARVTEKLTIEEKEKIEQELLSVEELVARE